MCLLGIILPFNIVNNIPIPRVNKKNTLCVCVCESLYFSSISVTITSNVFISTPNALHEIFHMHLICPKEKEKRASYSLVM